MATHDKPQVATQTQTDTEFKAVVKRLLDTPPKHKTGRPKPRKVQAATRKRAK